MRKSKDITKSVIHKTKPRGVSDKQILYWAESILLEQFKRSNFLSSPDITRNFLKIMFAKETREIFALIFLDNQNGVLGVEVLFQGTIDGAAVYPREVVKAVLDNHAAAVILSHNHPSGSAEPSQADQRITNRIVSALETIDVRVLDHLIVGGSEIVSFAERGLL